MKILFVGPSLFGQTPDLTGITMRPPAMQGDIARAVLEGATAIGLIDGYFDAVAAPWHKEILFALAKGVAMLGASSMGALRAAECASFGMLPVGSIAQAYCSGALDDDAAVALTHGPRELGYPPLTEPLVNVKPTLERLFSLGLLSEAELAQCWEHANRLYFKDRTDEALLGGQRPELLGEYRTYRVDRKAEDALLLIAELKRVSATRAEDGAWSGSSSLFDHQVLPALADAARGSFEAP